MITIKSKQHPEVTYTIQLHVYLPNIFHVMCRHRVHDNLTFGIPSEDLILVKNDVGFFDWCYNMHKGFNHESFSVDQYQEWKILTSTLVGKELL